MSSITPGLTLGIMGPSAHKMLPKIDADNPNDPELAYQKKLDFINAMEIWERDSGPGDVNVGVFTSKLRSQLSKPKKAAPVPPVVAPVKASQASVVKAEPKKIESTPQPVTPKKTKGQTIMDPLALKDVTYRKKLLGD